MKEIVCPNCKTTFQVDETAYSAILSQIRTREFDREIERRIAEIEKRHASMDEVAMLKLEKEFHNALRDKEGVIAELTARIAKSDQETRVKVLETRQASQMELHEKDRRIMELEATIQAQKHASESRELELKDHHKQQMRDKQEEIDRLKDFKLRLSTKMVGESLEQHCQIEFNRAKSFGQFPEAVLEKDNTVAEGTKGDFIFRDYVDGKEYVSIMFEMKNESDTTSTRQKNEHFFDKLDKDREKKGCEYAVLVSMLEVGNELYDSGIVDMSWKYPKMMVIRPQFFIPILRLISEGARKGYIQNRALLAELETARNESRDFSKFEEKITSFANMFGKQVKGAHDKFKAANDGIDKIIANLEKQISLLRDVKASFEASEQRMLKAERYVEENLTVKKLTHGAPLIRKMIEEAGRETED